MKNFDNEKASNIYFHNKFKQTRLDKHEQREQRIAQLQALNSLLAENPQLKDRFERVSAFSKQVRVSEYHLTNACNIRCQGCWFFKFEHDQETRSAASIARSLSGASRHSF
jgi:tRNA(Ile)-lysidine synthase TilS/MesJ